MFILAGCMSPPSPAHDVISTSDGIASPTSTSSTLQTASPTPLTTIDENLTDDCFAIIDRAPSQELGNGIVVFENKKISESGRVLPGLFLLDMSTSELKNLIGQNQNLLHAYVSPDSTSLSVERVTFDSENKDKLLNDELVIMTATGEIQKQFPMTNGAVSGAVWLNDQTLVINIAGLTPEENQGIKPSTLLVLKPFTNEQQTLKPDFPDMYSEYPLPLWDEPWGYSLSTYNSDLTYAVYISKDGYTYVLWDISAKSELLRFVHWNIAGYEQPRWSPDGSKFITNAYFGDMTNWPQPADGLYTIDVEGNVTKLIDKDMRLDIRDHFWSPSGRYIALFTYVRNLETEERQLKILDTQTLKITDTCVHFRNKYADGYPVWSPDEKQIIVYDEISREAGSQAILVDLAKSIAFPITKDMEPRGWMTSP